MPMIIAAHQPNFIPNPAFFYKQTEVDLFVIVTNIQFEKHEGWQQRHKIPGPNGDVWLTVPVLGSQNQLLKEVKIHNQIEWRRKHCRTLDLAYRKSIGCSLVPELTPLYDKSWDRLVELNIAFILHMRKMLSIETPIVVDEEVGGKGPELLINICRKYGATNFLSGAGSKLYMTKDYLSALDEAGIRHEVVEKNLTSIYPYSTLHYIFTDGPERAADLIRGKLV